MLASGQKAGVSAARCKSIVRSSAYRRMHHVRESDKHGGVALGLKVLSLLARPSYNEA